MQFGNARQSKSASVQGRGDGVYAESVRILRMRRSDSAKHRAVVYWRVAFLIVWQRERLGEGRRDQDIY
jgi:hypothetical protein